jgi:hypothetical protein
MQDPVYASRMHDHSDRTWPTGSDFLELAEAIAQRSAAETDARRTVSGKTYPLTLDGLGNVLSLLYRSACCHWGCRGGDHQAEWLVGRAVNQAMASYRLLRSAFYDESLMLTRGVGEIANLVGYVENRESSSSGAPPHIENGCGSSHPRP